LGGKKGVESKYGQESNIVFWRDEDFLWVRVLLSLRGIEVCGKGKLRETRGGKPD